MRSFRWIHPLRCLFFLNLRKLPFDAINIPGEHNTMPLSGKAEGGVPGLQLVHHQEVLWLRHTAIN